MCKSPFNSVPLGNPGEFSVKRGNLKGMKFDDLIALRDSAERLIRQRAAKEKSALEDRLARLTGFFGKLMPGRGRSLKGRKVAPKYRNPANRSETWAGRGARPRWLQAYLKDGRKLEDFAISKGAASRAKPAARKSAGRKPRKKRVAKSAA
jgi:DNA-binding protein H-NS